MILPRTDQKMLEAINDGVFPSASLLVATGDGIVMQKEYGNCTASSVFDVASLTKPVVTASLIVQAVSKGLIDLADTLDKFYVGDSDALKRVTIFHLLNHSSGFPAWKPFYKMLPKNIIGTKEGYDKIILSCLNEPLEYETGTKKVYSDIGFILLGDILQIVFKKPLDVLADDLVFKPVCAASSFYRRNEKEITGFDFVPTEDCPWRKKIIRGFAHDQNCFAMGGVAGHAGLFSTAHDLNLFVEEFIKSYEGKNSAGNILLGWDRPTPFGSQAGTKFSKETIGHLGFTGCSMWIDLEKKIWVILLSNRVHPTATNEKIKSFRPTLHDTIVQELAQK